MENHKVDMEKLGLDPKHLTVNNFNPQESKEKIQALV